MLLSNYKKVFKTSPRATYLRFISGITNPTTVAYTIYNIEWRRTTSRKCKRSTSAQDALECYKGHGLFTSVLAEGIQGLANTDKDGYVKKNELANYIEDTVPELAEKVFGRQQFP